MNLVWILYTILPRDFKGPHFQRDFADYRATPFYTVDRPRNRQAKYYTIR